MVDIFEAYGGWPVIEGKNWISESFNWLEISKQLSDDGLINVLLNWDVGIDLKNSSRRVLIVSILLQIQSKFNTKLR